MSTMKSRREQATFAHIDGYSVLPLTNSTALQESAKNYLFAGRRSPSLSNDATPSSSPDVVDKTTMSTKRLAVISSYIFIWTAFYLLVHYTGKDNDDMPSSASLRHLRSAIFVICVEVIKILLSCFLYLKANPSSHKLSSLPQLLKSDNLVMKYLPVALLYAIYNNLMFFNLSSNNPTVYLVISSSRLVMTTVVWQMHFKTHVTAVKKGAVILITCGMLVKDIIERSGSGVSDLDAVTVTSTTGFNLAGIGGLFLIVFQMSCSVLAGVYNEKLLKHVKCDQNVQNIAMYVNSIGVNLLVVLAMQIKIVVSGEGGMDSGGVGSMLANHLYILKTLVASTSSVLIIFTLATAGIMSSLILRHENSVTKGVASASEIPLTTVIEYCYFGQVYQAPEILGVMLVSLGTVVYSLPASSTKKGDTENIFSVWRLVRRGLICALFFLFASAHLVKIGTTFTPSHV